MQKPHLFKSTYNNQLQQSIYPWHKRNMCETWQVNTLAQSQNKRSPHSDAYLLTLTNVPIKCHSSTPYRIQEMAQARV